MRQYLIDTNYILRFLLKDAPKQTRIARRYFAQAKEGKIIITVPLLVFIELDFVLTKIYQFKKDEVVKRLTQIAQLLHLDIERRNFLLKALSLYHHFKLSFIDIIFYLEAQASGKKLLTFDKRLSKLKKIS